MIDADDQPGKFGLPEALEDEETREGFDFPPPERKVVTQSYDLSVQTLTEQWKTKILVLPEIQREYVWDDARASRLVESLLLNIPIPVVYFAETKEATYEVIDGHQRIRSIVRFLNNQFKLRSLAVLDEYNGLRYHELPDREQRFFIMRSIRAVIIAAESHSSMKFEIFERLNTGSIALNAQELRNSLYRGSFNRLLRELVSFDEFRLALKRQSPAKRMVDEELVLRFIALDEDYPDYKPPLKRFLNDFMQRHQNPTDAWLRKKADLFRDTVGKVRAAFGPATFRIANGQGQPLEGTVVRALFDAQMLTFAHVPESDPRPYRAEIARKMAPLFHDDEFIDVLRRATGDRSRLRFRVERVVEAISQAGLVVQIPLEWR